jgi:hypothetical protein
MVMRIISRFLGFRVFLAALVLTGGVLLVSACSNDDQGVPLPSAAYTPDKPGSCSGQVSLQASLISGRSAVLQVRVENVADVLAANFDILFQTFRCSTSQGTCFADGDCPVGEVCLLSGTPVARIDVPTISDTGSFLDCGLPGDLLSVVSLDPIVQERLVVGMVRNEFRACSSGTPCTMDTQCTPTGERCGLIDPAGNGQCVKPSSNCVTTPCTGGDVCVEGLCDAVGDAFLLSLPFEILTRGMIRVEFADPMGLEDASGPIGGIGFCGGFLQGI